MAAAAAALDREAAAEAAVVAAAAAALDRETARNAIAVLEAQLATERTRVTVEIPRLTESVCTAGAKIMALSDRIAASERARVELSQRLGAAEGALREVRAERARLEASEAATAATAAHLSRREAELVECLTELRAEMSIAEQAIAVQMADHATAAATYAAEENELQMALDAARKDFEVAMAASAAAEERVTAQVASLEAEIVERTAGEAAARAAEQGRAAAAAALSDDLGALRTTRQRQLEEVHAAAITAANEAEVSTRLQLAAGVVLVKRGRNGRLYRRVVRCDLDTRTLEWASVGEFKSMNLAATSTPPSQSIDHSAPLASEQAADHSGGGRGGARVEWAPNASEAIIHGPERAFTIELPLSGPDAPPPSQADAAVTAWMRAMHRRLGTYVAPAYVFLPGPPRAAPGSQVSGGSPPSRHHAEGIVAAPTPPSLESAAAAATDNQPSPPPPLPSMTYEEWVRQEGNDTAMTAEAPADEAQGQGKQHYPSPLKPDASQAHSLRSTGSPALGRVSSMTSAIAAHPLVKTPLGLTFRALKSLSRLSSSKASFVKVPPGTSSTPSHATVQRPASAPPRSGTTAAPASPSTATSANVAIEVQTYTGDRSVDMLEHSKRPPSPTPVAVSVLELARAIEEVEDRQLQSRRCLESES